MIQSKIFFLKERKPRENKFLREKGAIIKNSGAFSKTVEKLWAKAEKTGRFEVLGPGWVEPVQRIWVMGLAQAD